MRFSFSFLKKYNSETFAAPAATDFYTYNQPVSSSTWTIVHNLNNYVFFQAFDATGLWVNPSTAVTIDPNTTQLTFSTPLAGSCYCVREPLHTYSHASNTTWTFNHASGDRRVACAWVNNTTYVVPNTETNATLNQMLIDFPVAVSGTAVLIDENVSEIMDAANPYIFAHAQTQQVAGWLLDTTDVRYFPNSFQLVDSNIFQATFPSSQAGNRILASHG